VTATIPAAATRKKSMAWDFCADPDFQPTLDWITGFISDEVHPLEPLSAQEAVA
jgi:hypothetical protein